MNIAVEPYYVNHWVEWYDREEVQKALSLCKGPNQIALIEGRINLSLSCLKGKAKGFGSSYKRSIYNLLDRMDKAGVIFTEERRENNRRVLIIGRK